MEILGSSISLSQQVNLAARSMIAARFAGSTTKQYGSIWHKFETWCRRHNLTCLPAEKTTFNQFLVSELMHAPTSGRTICAAISNVHLAAELPDPTRSWFSDSARKGALQLAPVRRRPQAFQLQALKHWVSDIGNKNSKRTLIQLRDATLCAIGFRSMLRPEEISRILMGHCKTLLSTDTVTSVGYLLVPNDKAHQRSAGNIIYIDETKSDICPRRLLRRYVNLLQHFLRRKLKDEESLFWNAGLSAPMSKNAIASTIIRVHQKWNADFYITGKSLRIGGANAAARGNVPRELIKATGNWNSDQLDKYYRSDAYTVVGLSASMGF